MNGKDLLIAGTNKLMQAASGVMHNFAWHAGARARRDEVLLMFAGV
jgi:hypothetical protein